MTTAVAELVSLGGIGTGTGCAGCRWVELPIDREEHTLVRRYCRYQVMNRNEHAGKKKCKPAHQTICNKKEK